MKETKAKQNIYIFLSMLWQKEIRIDNNRPNRSVCAGTLINFDANDFCERYVVIFRRAFVAMARHRRSWEIISCRIRFYIPLIFGTFQRDGERRVISRLLLLLVVRTIGGCFRGNARRWSWRLGFCMMKVFLQTNKYGTFLYKHGYCFSSRNCWWTITRIERERQWRLIPIRKNPLFSFDLRPMRNSRSPPSFSLCI